MQIRDGELFFSPSDLITYMESPFASHMERLRHQDSSISDLMDTEDAMLKALQKKGFDHEDEYLERLKTDGKSVVSIERASAKVMQERTRAAVRAGPDVIAQAYLEIDNFGGLADFLVKVTGSSKLGDYHYEVWDTKLSKKMKPYFAVQLSCYAEMLEVEQGVRPQNVSIVLGNNEIVSLRVADYFAYYDTLKSAFLQFHKEWDALEQPDPTESVTYGRWSSYADGILADRRHLSLVANITRTQIKRLESASIGTIDELAENSLKSIPKLNNEVFKRLKAQAAIQIASEDKEKPIFEVLPHDTNRPIGLAILPSASKNDVFFDIEGFPLIDGGLEYLWGATYFEPNGERTFCDFWAHDHDQEKQAFSDFIDWIYSRWLSDPSMHVYHYASYEVSAMRRLMGRYGVKEHEVDTLLRNEVFIDLYKVVRHGVLIGEPRYSIKNVEHLYRGKRDSEVASGGESVVVYEEWRTNPDSMTWETSEVLKAIRDYNIDDCDSTQELAEWLREQQSVNGIRYIDTSSTQDTPVVEEVTETTRLRERLLNLAEGETNSTKQSVLRNLAWLLEFHRRENKPTWWRLFDRLGLTEIDLYDDMDCLTGLERTSRPSFLPTPKSRNHVYEYAFNANQPFKGQSKSFYVLGEDDLKVNAVDFDLDAGLVGLQSKTEPPERLSLIPDEYVRAAPIPDAIFDVLESMLETDFKSSAIVDFLFRFEPRFIDGSRPQIISPNLSGAEFIEEVISAVGKMNESYLCIQGPPGAGKTFTAKHVISDLLRKGKRVGVSSNSHRAIINLMDGVADQLLSEGTSAQLLKVGGASDEPLFDKDNVEFRRDAKACFQELNNPGLCIGGTAWLFCNKLLTEAEGTDRLDYLFIDEAGQVPVANLVGMSRSAKNLILMGDQMQLGQPSQGSHPDESGQSTLEYLLQENSTIPAHMGIFLPQTYRMHPDVCRLISEQVYEGRLNSAESTNEHVIDIPVDVLPKSSGVHFIPVDHEGNSQGSEEEVAVISRLAKQLIGCPLWTGSEVDWPDMLFVAPYNYQVNLLKAALPDHARIGSVDKFQGQEAPIVFLSMCASDASESPRGVDFLFSKNRLNVAISRAQSLAIVVGSPRLATTPVGNLKQMELVNFYSDIVTYGSQAISGH